MTDHNATKREASVTRQELLEAVVLAAVFLLLYVITRTRHFGGDDTVFALVVQRWLEVGSVERVLLHPHHLLYNPLVAACSWFVRALTGSVFVLDVGAAVSGAAAAAAVAGVYLVLRRYRVDENFALLTSVVLGVSGGMWRYATRIEVYPLAAAGVVVWLAVMSNPSASWKRLAAGFAAPWLGHSVLGLLALPGVWLHRRRPPVLAKAVGAGLVAPATVVVGFLAWLDGARSVSAVTSIVIGPGSGRWLSLPDPLAALAALRGLVALQAYHALPVYSQWVMTLFDALGALVTIVLAALVVWGTVVTIRDKNRLGVVAALGIASLVPLWLVWDVGNSEHAVAASPLFAALVALGASAAGRRIGKLSLAAVATMLLIVNGLGSALLGTQPNLSRTLLVADFVHETVPEGGALVTIGVDPELRLALPHLGGRRVIDLTSIVHSARRAGATPREALGRWLQLASAADGTWMLEDPGSTVTEQWIVELGVPKEAWWRARSMLRLGPGATLEADDVVIRQSITLHRLEVESD